MDEYPVESIRSRYAALRDVCYLNTGTIGVMSEPVLQRHLERVAHYERYGHVGEADARSAYEDARESFARLINASSDEIALNRNATDGVNFVLAGLSLPGGATLLTTDEEHPAVMFPITHAARRCNGNVATVSLGKSDDELLGELRQVLESKSVAIAVISHVSCETGRRLPIAEMVAACREHGVLSLVDGAQSVGQFPVDVEEIGCDFLTGNGHKWLCGPKGTGFLYVRRTRLEDLTPPYVGAGATDPPFDRAELPPYTDRAGWCFRDDAQRYEFGTRNWHLYGAVTDAVQELEAIGLSAIERHVAQVTGELKTALAERPGVEVHTPASWDRSCGLVTFSVNGWDGPDLSRRLWDDFKVIQRRVQIPNGVRVSCAHYTGPEEIDRFLQALDTLIDA